MTPIAVDRAAAIILCLAAGSLGCAKASTPQVEQQTSAPPGVVIVRDDLQSVFANVGTRGTFALLDVSSRRLIVVDRARAERRAVPASTFKIAHALIALETGSVRDEQEVIPYGGESQPVKAWEQDMTIGDAVRRSNAAIFQQIARRLGLVREREWLARLDYGNRQVGARVDQFWLEGPLEISPVEQVEFLARLAQGRLPVSAKTQQMVMDIIELERTADHVLYGKTGWRFNTPPPQLGWWVGWVKRGTRIHAFALNLDIRTEADAAKRIPVGRELLAQLGVLSPPSPAADPIVR